MAISSMTGFGRSEGSLGAAAWSWEIRAVNGRGLDIRLRLPPGHDQLESRIREAVARHLTRGSCTIALNVQRSGETTRIRLNEAALEDVRVAVARACEICKLPPPTLDAILSLRGVLEVVEAVEGEGEATRRGEAMLGDLDVALTRLAASRAEEGARLATVVERQIEEVESLAEAADRSPQRTPEAIRRRLADQVARLVEARSGFDAERLHQEAVLLSTRADIAEEIARLKSHAAAARALLSGAGPAGRKLDFLAQEFNREANTLCSKANDTELTRIGLQLKVVIDQLREQVQNIE